MQFKFNIRPKDIPLLTRALQSLESAPDSWFDFMPASDIPLIRNAARGFPTKMRFNLSNITYTEFYTLNLACDHQLETGKPSSRERDILQHYLDVSDSILDAFEESVDPDT